jgi:dinuclear metal center YbgI/SA1388 family protein
VAVRGCDLVALLDAFAPQSLAEPWDNVGLQVGDPNAALGRVCVGLTPDAATVDEAIALGATLLVVHHPLVFKPLRNVVTGGTGGSVARTVGRCITSGLAVYAAHTNLDAVVGGVNDALVLALGLGGVRLGPGTGLPASLGPALGAMPGAGLGRLIDLPEPTTVGALARRVAEALGEPATRVVGSPATDVSTVAVCGGSGADLIPSVAGLADVYVTGDVRYHEALDALDRGLCVIDAGHYATEWPVVRHLASAIRGWLASVRDWQGDVVVTRREGSPFAVVH